jgi:hypothetical protein
VLLYGIVPQSRPVGLILRVILGVVVSEALSAYFRKELAERAPKIVAELKAAKADAALLVPV